MTALLDCALEGALGLALSLPCSSLLALGFCHQPRTMCLYWCILLWATLQAPKRCDGTRIWVRFRGTSGREPSKHMSWRADPCHASCASLAKLRKLSCVQAAVLGTRLEPCIMPPGRRMQISSSSKPRGSCSSASGHPVDQRFTCSLSIPLQLRTVSGYAAN